MDSQLSIPGGRLRTVYPGTLRIAAYASSLQENYEWCQGSGAGFFLRQLSSSLISIRRGRRSTWQRLALLKHIVLLPQPNSTAMPT